MKPTPPLFIVATLCLLAGLCLSGCANLTQPTTGQLALNRIFPTDQQPSVSFTDSIIASPLLYKGHDQTVIIAAVANGIIAALNAETGALAWQIQAPAPAGELANLVATPVIIGDKLVFIYQCWDKGKRTSHRMAVLDLVQHRLDPDFPVLVMAAEQATADGLKTVKFNPPTAFSHSALKWTPSADASLGYVYAAFGNSGDEQPYHGWLFEIDLAAWQHGKTAIHKVLLTTPETDCPVTLEYGNQEMICGGGIWTPQGPQIFPNKSSYELIVPTGNGQLDLDRHDYANALLRVQPGLQFDAGCDAGLCRHFDPINPSLACIESCKNLFIPRLPPGSPALKPASGECDHKSFNECVAWLDYDLGAGAPIKVALANGKEVLVQPSKDGGVYLIDAEHLGTQYDRLQIVELCGSKTDECKFAWMGMIVTQAVQALVDDTPVVVIPTFVADNTHPAGLVALKIVQEQGQPRFKRFWQFPEPTSPAALQSFRSHPSLPVLSSLGGDAVVWVVDIGTHGTVYGIRIRDGALVAKHALKGAGRQLAQPLLDNNRLYVPSIMPGTNKTMIEAYGISPANP